MPDDLRGQIAPLHEIIKAMGLPLVVIDNVEADDVIGTLAKYATREGRHTLISTSDKDMAQLVDEHVTLINTLDNRISTPESVEERFGVRPDQIIDFLALMGDSSDNIPGMPGVGEKTAQHILQGIDSIDAMLAHPEKVAELGFRGAKGMPVKIAEHKELILLSRELATIKLDVDMPLNIEAFARKETNKDELIRLFKECEFRRWLGELLEEGGTTAAAPATPAKPATSIKEKAEDTTAATSSTAADNEPVVEPQQFDQSNYEVVSTEAALAEWVEKLKAADCYAFDTETTSLNYMEAELVG